MLAIRLRMDDETQRWLLKKIREDGLTREAEGRRIWGSGIKMSKIECGSDAWAVH